MEAKFSNRRISGMLTLVPQAVSRFDDEVLQYPFPEKQTRKLKKVMGFHEHRLSRPESTVSDFCVTGLRYLLDHGWIKKEEIGAVIVITVSPDYFLPHVSNIIHGSLGLDSEVLCMDIPQACCGFIYGILQGCCMLDAMRDKKVVVFNGDVLSHRICRKDRSEFPLTGDAAAVTVFEYDDSASDIFVKICSDGKDRGALIMPAGGFAYPASEDSALEKKCKDGNIRSDNDLHMDGSCVFDFVTEKVPPLFFDSMEKLGLKKNDIDYFLFHQPNKYLLERLGMELELPEERFFMNIVGKFGNPHGASIPLNICYNLAEEMAHGSSYCCLSGFGAGLTYGISFLELGKFDFCELIEVDL